MSNEGLTKEDYEILKRPFAPEDIGGKGKNAYIYRSAIMTRLEEVDLHYQEYIEPRTEVENDTVTVWGSLSLKGDTRWNCASVVIQCWRKEQDGSYTHFDDYEYAQALANAKMSASTGLLQRCAAKFGVGIEMKERAAKAAQAARKGQNPPPPTGQRPPAPPPPDPPPHWALNGDGTKIKARMNQLGLTWEGDLKSTLEPGKVLAKLSDTTLTYDQVYHKMDEIKAAKVAAELEAQRKAQPPSQKGDEPISVQGDDLQLGDLVYGLGGSHPGRLVYKLGEDNDGAFTSWAVWKNTQFTDTVSAMLFEHRLRFKVTRTAEPLSLPDKILSQIESLKAEHASLTEGSITTL